MEDYTWRFTRGSDTLEITRQGLDDGIMLVIQGDGVPRSYFFRDILRLEIFQKDMETLLLKTGWTFLEYAPDRRSGIDRRNFPRRANDRRRWWTDGTGRSTRSGEYAEVRDPETRRSQKLGTKSED